MTEKSGDSRVSSDSYTKIGKKIRVAPQRPNEDNHWHAAVWPNTRVSSRSVATSVDSASYPDIPDLEKMYTTSSVKMWIFENFVEEKRLHDTIYFLGRKNFLEPLGHTQDASDAGSIPSKDFKMFPNLFQVFSRNEILNSKWSTQGFDYSASLIYHEVVAN